MCVCATHVSHVACGERKQVKRKWKSIRSHHKCFRREKEIKNFPAYEMWTGKSSLKSLWKKVQLEVSTKKKNLE